MNLNREAAGAAPRHILLVKTSSLGDIVHNFPMVTDLQRHFPGAVLDWVVEQAFADLPRLHPAIRHVIPVALRRWRHGWARRENRNEARQFVRALRAEHYDVVLDTQGLIKSAFIAALARGPVWGADFRSAREPLASTFYRRRVPMGWQQHALERNREVAARLFGYARDIYPRDYGLAPCSGPDQNYILCLPFTSRASKTWPDGQWRALLAALDAAGYRVLLPHANDAERAHAARLATGLSRIEILPRLKLGALAQVLAQARLVIGVDTGLLHLGTAYARPTIGLFVDSDPMLNGAMAAATGAALNLGRRGQTVSAPEVLSAAASLGLST